ncbi:MAG: biotin/lipoyl-binding protein [Prevotellaceae bacterium]|jgi:biotin carboxyl carrier protein|nr:biotin/lipoyl-binding protein [Prevotellaceae bacterium]
MKEFKMKINGSEYNVNIENIEDTHASVEVNGTMYHVEIDKPIRQAASVIRQVITAKPASTTATSSVTPVKVTPAAAQTSGANIIKSPLPGVIIDVCVKVGDAVKTGQKLFVLEAMKMENSINAESDGKVTEIKVNKGDSVLEGADLIVIG